MKSVLKSYGRALLMQLNVRMLLLTLLPSLLGLILWGFLLALSLQPLIDFLQQNLVSGDMYRMAGELLTFFGLLALKAFLVPLIAMWLLLPVMLLTALVFVSVVAMPLMNRSISRKYFAQLEKQGRACWWRSAGFALLSLAIFSLLWLVSLPLSLLLPIGLILEPVLIGWLTYRVMTYDALASHATVEERRTIMQTQRWQLWVVGIMTGLLSTLPGMIWMGGALWIFVLPLFAAVAIWLYVVVFMFSGLWFQLFCLDALERLRRTQAGHISNNPQARSTLQ